MPTAGWDARIDADNERRGRQNLRWMLTKVAPALLVAAAPCLATALAAIAACAVEAALWLRSRVGARAAHLTAAQPGSAPAACPFAQLVEMAPAPGARPDGGAAPQIPRPEQAPDGLAATVRQRPDRPAALVYKDADGDEVRFEYTDGKLYKSVNGRRKVGAADFSGIVTKLTLDPSSRRLVPAAAPPPPAEPAEAGRLRQAAPAGGSGRRLRQA
eukprot:gene14427-22193_t